MFHVTEILDDDVWWKWTLQFQTSNENARFCSGVFPDVFKITWRRLTRVYKFTKLLLMFLSFAGSCGRTQLWQLVEIEFCKYFIWYSHSHLYTRQTCIQCFLFFFQMGFIEAEVFFSRQCNYTTSYAPQNSIPLLYLVNFPPMRFRKCTVPVANQPKPLEIFARHGIHHSQSDRRPVTTVAFQRQMLERPTLPVDHQCESSFFFSANVVRRSNVAERRMLLVTGQMLCQQQFSCSATMRTAQTTDILMFFFLLLRLMRVHRMCKMALLIHPDTLFSCCHG